ncbi:hypothetical protein GE061_000462 [Apolygus lucorum]|uniref:DET1- and DDB1-associated protein 1 n=1 Tax=Apolygus lucorum TaxID=248454 RepID=A0A6A4KKQ9_APOLU|nr:hypothetical protein GE061_000462 [Apolygus lucorum]
MSAISEFLSGLPSYDVQNFSKYADNQGRLQTRKPALHLPTTESPADQVIVPEKSNILLRYLHQKWEKENPDRKRELNDGELPSHSLKRPRYDDSDDSG